ncbi:flagellar biosynthesis anti-sigma factor FlgM [Neobacillus sp. SM06]|uniref:flagellar biosynthesis anti-sigma factor FlgM n=1 Tax=Neobacillus sp. SM06 TaxID=3422492 RepID=UPI003D2A33C5
MTMKINPYGSQGVNPYKQQMNKFGQTEEKTIGKKADRVEISATAKEMQQLSQLPEERQAKIQELKNQVENGSYIIDPHKIATSIIAFYSKQ